MQEAQEKKRNEAIAKGDTVEDMVEPDWEFAQRELALAAGQGGLVVDSEKGAKEAEEMKKKVTTYTHAFTRTVNARARASARTHKERDVRIQRDTETAI